MRLSTHRRMMFISEYPVIFRSSWCAPNSATGWDTGHWTQDQDPGAIVEAKRESSAIIARPHGTIRSAQQTSWSNGRGALRYKYLAGLSISYLGARTSLLTWSSCNNHPARWRIPECCHSCEAWISAAMTLAWVRRGFNGY